MNSVTSSDYTLVTVYVPPLLITLLIDLVMFLLFTWTSSYQTLDTYFECFWKFEQMFPQRIRNFEVVHLKKIGKVY